MEEIVTIKRLIDKGVIGRIGQVGVQFHMGCWFGPENFRSRMAHPLLEDMSIHHFDLVRHFTGEDAESVMGRSWSPDWYEDPGECSCSLVFRMTGGVAFEYSGSWCTKGQFCDWNGNWLIEGDRGTIVYANGEITLYAVPDRYRIKRSKSIPLAKLRLRHQAAILNEFMKGVRSGERAPTDVVDNIKSISMVFAALKAVKAERPVRV
jgi:predicted dehydrogenase